MCLSRPLQPRCEWPGVPGRAAGAVVAPALLLGEQAASPPAVPAALLALLRHVVSCTRALILVKLHLSAGVLPAGVSSWFVPVLRRGHWRCEWSGRWGAPSATSVCSLAGRHQSCRAAFGWALLAATGPFTKLSDLRWQSEGAGGSRQPPEEQMQS